MNDAFRSALSIKFGFRFKNFSIAAASGVRFFFSTPLRKQIARGAGGARAIFVDLAEGS